MNESLPFVVVMAFIAVILIILLQGCNNLNSTQEIPKTSITFKFFDESTSQPISVNYKMMNCINTNAISEADAWATYTVAINGSCDIEAYGKGNYPYKVNFSIGSAPMQFRFYLERKMADEIKIGAEGFNSKEGQLLLNVNAVNGSYNVDELCIHWSTNVVYAKNSDLNESTDKPTSVYYNDIMYPIDQCYELKRFIQGKESFKFNYKNLPSVTEEDFILFMFKDNYYYDYNEQVGFSDRIFVLNYLNQ